MSEDKRNGRGQFTKGNSGRPPGIENKAFADLREIRTAIVKSWDVVDGPKLLRDLARKRPEAYLKLVISVLPKAIEGEGAPRLLEIVVRRPAGVHTAEHLRLTAQRKGELDASDLRAALLATPVDLSFDDLK